MEEQRRAIVEKLLSGDYSFEELAFEIYHHQYNYNPLYHEFCRNLGRSQHPVELSQIPFLPIRFFKSHVIKTGNFVPEIIFRSSGTTDTGRSQHMVRDRKIYEQISARIFETTYGPLDDFIILALLPSYLEQGDSSLVSMIQWFIENTNYSKSRFYRYDFEQLIIDIQNYFGNDRKIILWGVTYALLDFAERSKINMKDSIIIETGGMKGRREELIRSEVHHILKSALQSKSIHSEYGMTELLSQSYSGGNGIFRMGETMKIHSFDIMDPLTPLGDGQSGRCHVIDLANVDSCSFVATDDLCRTDGDDFEILGRMDFADIRGCNLMYQ